MIPRMPFGKFKGWSLSEIPTSCLEWLSTIELYDDLRRAVAAQLMVRSAFFDEDPGCQLSTIPPPELQPALREIVQSGYRAAAMRHHPDVGGTDEDMLALTEAVRWPERSILQGDAS